jgi:DNA polymerase III epsilon subunit-like protein
MAEVFVDVETTGLHAHLGAVPWEIAAVEADGTEHLWTLPLTDVQLALADEDSLIVNGWHDRRPGGLTIFENPATVQARSASEIAALLDGRTILGVNVGFDVAMLGPWLRSYGHDLTAHYRPISVEAVALGWLHGRAAGARTVVPAEALAWPWRSDDLSRACGVEPPADDDRHTALGDARWARRWWFHLRDGVPTSTP